MMLVQGSEPQLVPEQRDSAQLGDEKLNVAHSGVVLAKQCLQDLMVARVGRPVICANTNRVKIHSSRHRSRFSLKIFDKSIGKAAKPPSKS